MKQYTSGTWTAVDKCKVYKSQEVESALPLTMLGDGEPLTDYKLYGNTENGESVGEQTENLFDKNTCTIGYYFKEDGNLQRTTSGTGWNISDYIECEEGKTYTAYNMQKAEAVHIIVYMMIINSLYGL